MKNCISLKPSEVKKLIANGSVVCERRIKVQPPVDKASPEAVWEPVMVSNEDCKDYGNFYWGWSLKGSPVEHAEGIFHKFGCPFNSDKTMWVREKWMHAWCPNDPLGTAIYLDEKGQAVDSKNHPSSPPESINWCRMHTHKSASQMPQWASRLNVDVESLKVIKKEDGAYWFKAILRKAAAQ